mmetsp:Transcript_87023/g.246749  ORF Transcript_87023/g.246749 Transcript_87023/m.246749 type:complete len:234 (-) Transcript_87023:1210-1911(-)
MSRIVCSTWPLSQLLRRKDSLARSLRASSYLTEAALSARWSEGGPSLARSSQCACLACDFFASEKGVTSGERCERAAAAVKTDSTPPNSDASSAIFPRRTSQGSLARHRPMGVAAIHGSSPVVPAGRGVSSTAPRARSVATAWSTRSFGGGSSASPKQLGCIPEVSVCSSSSMSEQRKISGTGKSWSRSSKRLRVMRQKLKPSRTRPARPRRCRTSARETNCSLSDDVFEGSW